MKLPSLPRLRRTSRGKWVVALLGACAAVGTLTGGCAGPGAAGGSINETSPKAAPLLAAVYRSGELLSRQVGPYWRAYPLAALVGRDRGQPDQWRAKYKRLTEAERAHYCIYQLRNERYKRWVGAFAGRRKWYEPYDDNPESRPSQELVKLGKAAIPTLIAALDDWMKTHIYPSRWSDEPRRVQDVAFDIIQKITCRRFSHDSDKPADYQGFSQLTPAAQSAARKRIRKWWNKNRHGDEIAWATSALLKKQTDPPAMPSQAATNLGARLGPKSHPILAKAFARLAKDRDSDGIFDKTRWLKTAILYVITATPAKDDKPTLYRALNDACFEVRLLAADGLWKLGDDAGLKRLLAETAKKHMGDFGSRLEETEYGSLISFFLRCNTPESRETIYVCLRARNTCLRSYAIYFLPELQMEKAVRALPALLDDPFVLARSYESTDGEGRTITVPPRRMCDIAALIFNKVVPESPRFGGRTEAEQNASIRKIAQWWQANRDKLVWDKARGFLVLPQPRRQPDGPDDGRTRRTTPRTTSTATASATMPTPTTTETAGPTWRRRRPAPTPATP